jgi:hypothetical protein
MYRLGFKKYSDFEKELTNLINKHSMENGSDTPDFMLARFLTQALINYDLLAYDRDLWYKGEKDK